MMRSPPPTRRGATLTIAALLLALAACTPPVDANPPDAPTNLGATAGNASVAVAFTIVGDGGSPITLLEYTLDDGASWNDATATTSPLQLSGLTNDQPLTFRLRATNAAGTSPTSDAITATPTVWPFATGAGGGANRAFGIGALADGSAIVAGYFQGAVTFGATTLTSAGGDDVFVARVDPDGSWAWATRAGGSGGDLAFGVGTLADGSAIVAGYFEGTADFGATTLVSAGARDVFAAKISPDGLWAWATSAGGAGTQAAMDVSTFDDGGAIVVGSFQDSATFGDTTLTGDGFREAFVARIDPDGSWAWAASGGGAGLDQAFGVGTLADGSVIVTGNFEGTASFGATTLTSEGSGDLFVARVDPDGSWAWATSAGGASFNQALGISTLPDGSAIVTGNFRIATTFGATTLTSAGGSDVFVARVDPDGSWAWATRAGGVTDASATSVSATADGGAIVAGSFEGAAGFGANSLTSVGGRDVFVAKIDPDGSWAWAARAGGTDDDYAQAVRALADGSALVAGYARDTTSFGATTLLGTGSDRMFVAKVSVNGAW